MIYTYMAGVVGGIDILACFRGGEMMSVSPGLSPTYHRTMGMDRGGSSFEWKEGYDNR